MGLCFLDLFAGAGGLSEGFIRAGYEPIAHVEMDNAASFTLKTRAAFHWLKGTDQLSIYYDYLTGKISRDSLYDAIPKEILDTVINKEIGESSLKDIFTQINKALKNRKLDLIIGGPPCQAYSLVGRSSDKNKMLEDSRCYLFRYYVQFLKKYRPKYFVFENVLGLLSAKDSQGNKYFDEMQEAFKQAGYQISYKLIAADEYGIPQKRQRIIIIGRRGKTVFSFPQLLKTELTASISELLQDLPKLNAGEGNILGNTIYQYGKCSALNAMNIAVPGAPITLHCSRPQKDFDLEIYHYVADIWRTKKIRVPYDMLPIHLKTRTNTACFKDRYKVVAGEEKACHTIIAHIAKDGHYYIHPDVVQNRSLTPREAARIQTFPDDYFFETVSGIPGRGPAFKQIGNAVPVLLAEQIAKKLLEVWK